MNPDPASSKYYDNPANRELLQWLPAGGSRVLDLGAGSGENAKAMCDQGLSVDCVTLSQREADRLSDLPGKCYVWNLEDGLPENLNSDYDVVFASHVLEHIAYPQRLLNSVHQALVPGGLLLIAIPNIFWWRTRLGLLMGRFDYAENGIMDYTHLRWYSLSSAAKLIEGHGFRLIKIYGKGHLPMPFIRNLIPKRVSFRLDRLCSDLAPGLFCGELILIASKPIHALING